ncbi:MAG: saccharopine dehydrogenase NADP-binding domain-containing protein, partial [Acidimicrobiia bacterium]
MHQPPKILILGCGSVAQCTVPLLLREQIVPPHHITILDMVDNRHRVVEALEAGVSYVVGQITAENLPSMLGAHLGAGDLCIDLAWNIDCCEILEWCRDHGVRYLNTSVEVWDPYTGAEATDPLERTLYVRHMAIRRMINSWGRNDGPTAVVEHGANPGLVSHFAKQALSEIAQSVLSDSLLPERAPAIEDALTSEQFNLLAHELGVKVIHISERDTQVSASPKRVDEFVNTWSVDGFY